MQPPPPAWRRHPTPTSRKSQGAALQQASTLHPGTSQCCQPTHAASCTGPDAPVSPSPHTSSAGPHTPRLVQHIPVPSQPPTTHTHTMRPQSKARPQQGGLSVLQSATARHSWQIGHVLARGQPSCVLSYLSQTPTALVVSLQKAPAHSSTHHTHTPEEEVREGGGLSSGFCLLSPVAGFTPNATNVLTNTHKTDPASHQAATQLLPCVTLQTPCAVSAQHSTARHSTGRVRCPFTILRAC